jgi:hypothetical protein
MKKNMKDNSFNHEIRFRDLNLYFIKNDLKNKNKNKKNGHISFGFVAKYE